MRVEMGSPLQRGALNEGIAAKAAPGKGAQDDDEEGRASHSGSSSCSSAQEEALEVSDLRGCRTPEQEPSHPEQPQQRPQGHADEDPLSVFRGSSGTSRAMASFVLSPLLESAVASSSSRVAMSGCEERDSGDETLFDMSALSAGSREGEQAEEEEEEEEKGQEKREQEKEEEVRAEEKKKEKGEEEREEPAEEEEEEQKQQKETQVTEEPAAECGTPAAKGLTSLWLPWALICFFSFTSALVPACSCVLPPFRP